MMRTLREHTSPAQALVEFALAATLMFFLLAAVVDLGLIYFTMQALRVAAQEGATYGSYPRVEEDAQGRSNVVIDYSEIVYRIYGSTGERGGGFADLRDLNSDGIDDLGQGLHNSMATDPDAYIYIENLAGFDPESLSNVGCRGDLSGEQLQAGGRGCWLRVTVRYDYNMLFPFAPAFGDTIQLRVAYLTPMRSTVFTTAQ